MARRGGSQIKLTGKSLRILIGEQSIRSCHKKPVNVCYQSNPVSGPARYVHQAHGMRYQASNFKPQKIRFMGAPKTGWFLPVKIKIIELSAEKK